MRRLVVFALVALVGLTPLAALPTAAQFDSPDFGPLGVNPPFEGVAKPRAQVNTQTPADAPILQPYEVYFGERFARLVNRGFAAEFVPEFMVIEVKQGTFALQVADQGTFIVDPAGETPIQHVELPNSVAPPFVNPLPNYVRNAAGNICTNMCAIPLNTAVEVNPGDIVIAHANALCLWCLLKGSNPEDWEDPAFAGTGTPTPLPDSGILLVSVLLEPAAERGSFSWIQAWNAMSGVVPPALPGSPTPTPDTATPSANAQPMTMAMAWAFNPPTGCN